MNKNFEVFTKRFFYSTASKNDAFASSELLKEEFFLKEENSFVNWKHRSIVRYLSGT